MATLLNCLPGLIETKCLTAHLVNLILGCPIWGDDHGGLAVQHLSYIADCPAHVASGARDQCQVLHPQPASGLLLHLEDSVHGTADLEAVDGLQVL